MNTMVMLVFLSSILSINLTLALLATNFEPLLNKSMLGWILGYEVFSSSENVVFEAGPHTARLPCGLGVRIRGSHPRGPGSIPGTGKHFCFTILSLSTRRT